MQPYYCALLRYFHDGTMHEFLNIGVLVWVPVQRQIYLAISKKTLRIEALFPAFEPSRYNTLLDVVISTMQNAKPQVALQTEDTETQFLHLLQDILPTLGGCFQWSPMLSGAAADFDQEVADLFYDYIGQYDDPDQRCDHAEKIRIQST